MNCNNCSHSKLVEHGKFYLNIEEHESTDLVCNISGDVVDDNKICDFWEEE